ncbi:hypothetical protein [Nocardia sp. CY41]|uniref:hypothetical protein n=1 Tax=Nocardia sp. CY41 TaxID=2608686 RepID=UPI001F1763EF|nr:hypothetical protein [Nocardia sp. CY41]
MPIADDPSVPIPLRILDDEDFRDPFAPPSDAERAARRTELLSRARQVRADDWDDYRYTWSTGEVLAVALLLDDDKILADCDETCDSMLRRWAYDLYGIRGGRTDVQAGCPQTSAWFRDTAAELAATAPEDRTR